MKRSLKVAIAVLCLALLVITPVVYHWRPLIPSLALHATYEDGPSGLQHARVYRVLFRKVVFIELPERAEGANRWFAVDLGDRTVWSPFWPGRSPYLHYDRGTDLGVPLDYSVKLGDWRVNWSGDRVTWSDGKTTVRLGGA